MGKLDKHAARKEKRARNESRKARGVMTGRGSRRTQLSRVQKVLLGGGQFKSMKAIGGEGKRPAGEAS